MLVPCPHHLLKDLSEPFGTANGKKSLHLVLFQWLVGGLRNGPFHGGKKGVGAGGQVCAV